MAFPNNFYPVGYQPQPYPNLTPNLPQMNVQQNTGTIYVQGEAGAKGYLVAPNQTVDLWDTEAPVIYRKSSNAAGVPSMRIIDYTFRDEPKQTMPVQTEFVTKDELAQIRSEIDSLRAEFAEKSQKGESK